MQPPSLTTFGISPREPHHHLRHRMKLFDRYAHATPSSTLPALGSQGSKDTSENSSSTRPLGRAVFPYPPSAPATEPKGRSREALSHSARLLGAGKEDGEFEDRRVRWAEVEEEEEVTERTPRRRGKRRPKRDGKSGVLRHTLDELHREAATRKWNRNASRVLDGVQVRVDEESEPVVIELDLLDDALEDLLQRALEDQTRNVVRLFQDQLKAEHSRVHHLKAQAKRQAEKDLAAVREAHSEELAGVKAQLKAAEKRNVELKKLSERSEELLGQIEDLNAKAAEREVEFDHERQRFVQMVRDRDELVGKLEQAFEEAQHVSDSDEEPADGRKSPLAAVGKLEDLDLSTPQKALKEIRRVMRIMEAKAQREQEALQRKTKKLEKQLIKMSAKRTAESRAAIKVQVQLKDTTRALALKTKELEVARASLQAKQEELVSVSDLSQQTISALQTETTSNQARIAKLEQTLESKERLQEQYDMLMTAYEQSQQTVHDVEKRARMAEATLAMTQERMADEHKKQLNARNRLRMRLVSKTLWFRSQLIVLEKVYADILRMDEFMQPSITCKGCLLPFQNPHMLDCGHTFCAKCLGSELLIDPTHVSCAECRQVSRREAAIANSTAESIASRYAWWTVAMADARNRLSYISDLARRMGESSTVTETVDKVVDTISAATEAQAETDRRQSGRLEEPETEEAPAEQEPPQPVETAPPDEDKPKLSRKKSKAKKRRKTKRASKLS